jgi:ATP-dependent RNA helicase DDX35
MLSVGSIFVNSESHDNAGFKQTDFAVEEGDHITFLNGMLNAMAQRCELESWFSHYVLTIFLYV